MSRCFAGVRWRSLLAVAFAFLAPGASPALREGAPASNAPMASGALAFRDVTVIDVTNGRRVPNQTVLVVGTRIQAVGPAGKVLMPTDARVVDGRGKYLIPGLWDMHTHSRRSAHFFYPLFIAYGVTGIRDAGSDVPLDTLAQWKRAIAAGTRVGPRLIVVGQSIDERVPCRRLPVLYEHHACVSGAADARHLVDSLKTAGADMIKTYALSRPVYLAIAAEARRLGIPFGGHLYAPDLTAAEASDSGARILDHQNTSGRLGSHCWGATASIERCQPLAERLRRNGTWWVPTLSFFAVNGQPAGGPRSQAVYARFTEQARAF